MYKSGGGGGHCRTLEVRLGTTELPEVDPREAVRTQITLRVRLAWDNGECLAYTTNLSSTGLFAETRDYIPEGTAIRVEFDLAEAGALGRVYADGTVARRITEGEAEQRQLMPGVGIRFDEFVVGKFDLLRFLTPAEKPEKRVDELPERPVDPENRREAPRVATGLPVAWGCADPPDSSGYLAHLSTSGAFSIQTDEPCPIGKKIYLIFELPRPDGPGATRVRAIANVVRAVDPGGERPAGMGVHFDSSSVDVETIRTFIKGRRAWERQLAEESQQGDNDWVAPSADLPSGIEPRRGGESLEPERGLSMKDASPARPAPPQKEPKKNKAPTPTLQPLTTINWKWISLILAVALLVLAIFFAITWVFSG